MTVASIVGDTSSTGGTGALVLSAITSGILTNCSQYTDIWGTTGNPRWVDYSIHEYTDSTLTVLLQSEHGTCPITFAGSVGTLNRAGTNAKIKSTWIYGTGYAPSANSSSSPSYVNFGSVSANIRITISPCAGSIYMPPPTYNATNSGTGSGSVCDLLGTDSLAADNTELSIGQPSQLAMTANYRYYIPLLVWRSGLYSQATIAVQVAAASSSARCALYDDNGSGWAGNLRADFVANGGTQWNCASTGLKTITMSAPIYLSCGWYVWGFMTNGTPTLTVRANTIISPMGTQYASDTQAGYLSATYGAFPSTADAASSVKFLSNATAPTILLQ